MEPFTRCRIVIDSDLESSATLSTGRLKKLAGGDEMKWRGLHSGFARYEAGNCNDVYQP